MIIGMAAYCGSGQDTLADSICKIYGLTKYSMGDLVRKLAEEQGKNKDRGTLRSIRQECDNAYGRLYFPQMLIKIIKNGGNKNCIITGIRTVEEYKLFSEAFEFRFIFLNAKENIRLARMLRRKDEKDEKTIDLLREQMREENSLFDYVELEKFADIYFEFNINIKDYKKKEKIIVSKIMKELRYF